MARTGYLLRINGRYVFNSRFAPFANPNELRNHIRFALRTASYRTAVRRLALVLPTVLQLRACEDFGDYARTILGKLDCALQVDGPYTEDHLVFWTAIETATKHFLVEARARDYPFVYDLPDFAETWKSFVDRQRRIEKALRRQDLVRGTALRPVQAQPAPSRTDVNGPPSDGELLPFRESLFRRRPSLERPMPVPSFEDLENSPNSSPVPRAAEPVPTAERETESHPRSGVQAADQTGPTEAVLFSQARQQILDSRARKKGDRRDDEDMGRVLQFAIDFLGDRPIASYSQKDWADLETAITEIPHHKRIDLEKRSGKGKVATPATIYERYLFGKDHPGRVGAYISETTVKGTYHRYLTAFFSWAKKKRLLRDVPYEFDLVAYSNPAPTKRDAFKNDEVLRIFSLPLFQGSRSEERYWQPGNVLVQNAVYWAFVLIFIMGLRHSEAGKLLVQDFVEEDGRWFIDLKPLDNPEAQSSGDKNKKRKLKTEASARKLPVPAVLIELGLIERRDAVKAAGFERVFPDWPIYINPTSGREMVGQSLAKTWQYVKKTFQFDRKCLTLYGGRHTRAGWFDAMKIPDRLRNMWLGHTPKTAAEGYGPNEFSEDDIMPFEKGRLEIELRVLDLLLGAKRRADAGELRRVILPRPKRRKDRLPPPAKKKPGVRRRGQTGASRG